MSLQNKKPISILIADDDSDDRAMIKEAFEENFFLNELHFVEDGEELMNYLNRAGKYTDPDAYPLPGLILLDLNMPRKDGREALEEIFVDLVQVTKTLGRFWLKIVTLPTQQEKIA